MKGDPPTYERTGNPEIPEWWWKIARPLLVKPGMRAAIVAEASRRAGRENPWGADAITKFLDDEDPKGRTVAFVNALSLALSIPRPFYTAPTEDAARRMAFVEAEEKRLTPDQERRGAELDRAAAHEHRAAIDQRDALPSRDEGTDRSRRSRRTPRRRA